MQFKYYYINGEYFYYTPEELDLQHELTKIILSDYFGELEKELTSEQIAKLSAGILNFTEDNDNWQKLYEDYEDRLHSAFSERAFKYDKED